MSFNNKENRQLPKWFKYVSNPLLSIVVWPTLIWVIYAIVIKEIYPLTFGDYLSSFWWYPVKFSIGLCVTGILAYRVSDSLEMGLRKNDSNNILRPIGFAQHYQKHIEFETPFKKVLSIFTFLMSLLAPFMGGWAFFGSVVWFFSKNTI